MAKQNRTILKNYFQTGDKPSQAQYVDFIDSKVNLSENNTGNIQLTGNLTASGGISASGTLIANEANIKGHITASGNISVSGNLIAQHITASGNISASGTITTENADVYAQLVANKGNAGAGDFIARSSNKNHMLYTDANKDKVGIGFHNPGGSDLLSSLHVSGGLTVNTNITSSGNISASGYISAYGSSSLAGLPTSEPTTAGALWLSGSSTSHPSSSYLMVYNP